MGKLEHLNHVTPCTYDTVVWAILGLPVDVGMRDVTNLEPVDVGMRDVTNLEPVDVGMGDVTNLESFLMLSSEHFLSWLSVF